MATSPSSSAASTAAGRVDRMGGVDGDPSRFTDAQGARRGQLLVTEDVSGG